PRRREPTAAVRARRGRPAASATGQGAVPRRGHDVASFKLESPPAGDWTRGTQGDCRRDGAVPLMLKPRALKPGSRIAVVAPASSFKREEFDAGIAEIGRLGFVPVYDDSVFAKGRPAYVAGSAEVRARAIRSALSDPTID